MDVSASLKKYILFTGIAFLPLAVIVIICDSLTHTQDEESLKYRQSYSAFWVGLPYLILSFIMIYMSREQKKNHVKFCRLFSIVCFILSLLAIVLEAPDWNFYIIYHNYVCEKDNSEKCGTTSRLSGLFGSITVAVIVALSLCVSNILLCNWLLFRMSVETPEMDFERLNRKQRSISTQFSGDGDNFFKTQGYHSCWNANHTHGEDITPRKREIEDNELILQL